MLYALMFFLEGLPVSYYAPKESVNGCIIKWIHYTCVQKVPISGLYFFKEDWEYCEGQINIYMRLRTFCACEQNQSRKTSTIFNGPVRIELKVFLRYWYLRKWRYQLYECRAIQPKDISGHNNLERLLWGQCKSHVRKIVTVLEC